MMTSLSRPLIFGEVLFDCFPDATRVLGGAPFNVAWHCQAFGLSPLFVSRIGNDELGEQIVAAMQQWGMDTSALQQDTKHPSGVVEVSFADGEPAYDIVENSAWDFIEDRQLAELSSSGWLYHGSLASRSQNSAQALQQLRQSPRSVFVDINLRPPWWQRDSILSLIENVQLLKLNEDELMQLVPDAASIEQAMARVIDERSIQQLIVTLGERGVIACVRGQDIQRAVPATKATVIDTVGAGDAFSSILLLGQYRGWSLQDTLQRAQAFASAIVGIRGATISQQAFYDPFITDWDL